MSSWIISIFAVDPPLSPLRMPQVLFVVYKVRSVQTEFAHVTCRQLLLSVYEKGVTIGHWRPMCVNLLKFWRDGLAWLTSESLVQVHSYRNPVLFNDAAQAIPKDALILEIGPHSILRSPLRQARPDLGYANAMKKGEPALESLATCVGDLWRKGVPVKWSVENLPQNTAGSEGWSQPLFCLCPLFAFFSLEARAFRFKLEI